MPRSPYLQLIRPANVATALADVLAGFAVAGLARPTALPWLLISTGCLYAGGIVLNDYFDRDLDAVERPERPIPSHRVSPARAAALGTGLLGAGILAASVSGTAAGLVAVGISAAVLLYDAWGKHQGLFGPINMGTCRGLNLLLGVAAVPPALAHHWPLALVSLTYIAAVTAVSRGEVRGGQRGVAGFALTFVCGVLVALLGIALGPRNEAPLASVAACLYVLALAWRVVPAFWGAFRDPGAATIRRAVRTGVLSLVLVDAVIGAAYTGMIYSLAILATAVAAGWLARQFAVT